MGSAARVTQNHLSKPEDLMLQPLSGNQRPDLLTSLISMSLVPRLPQKLIASLQILFECPTPAIVFGNATKPSRFAHF